MTHVEERLFMLDLAIVQLIAGILITLGSTLFAISIGFGLTIPTVMREAITQMLVMNTEVAPEIQQAVLQESLSNYVLILAVVGLLLIAIGILFASAKTSNIRKQIKTQRSISNLLATDIQDPDETQTQEDSGRAARHRVHRNRLRSEQSDQFDTSA